MLTACGLATAMGAHAIPLSTVVAEQDPPMDARVSGGAVMIVGGGAVTPEIRKRFVELAGGPSSRIVIIPGYDPQPDGEKSILSPWRASGMASVTLLNARDRSMANNPAFYAPLKQATGVWFGGGFQSYLAERYVDTAIQNCLHELLKRNGVVGGCSAGAAILSGVMIREGDTTPVEARGLDLVASAIIDQHLLARNRLWRLEQMVEAHPDLVGLGVDEATGLVIQPRTRRLYVLGESYVVACLPGTGPHLQRIEILKPGDDVTLPQLRNDHLAYRPIDQAYAGSGPP